MAVLIGIYVNWNDWECKKVRSGNAINSIDSRGLTSVECAHCVCVWEENANSVPRRKQQTSFKLAAWRAAPNLWKGLAFIAVKRFTHVFPRIVSPVQRKHRPNRRFFSLFLLYLSSLSVLIATNILLRISSLKKRWKTYSNYRIKTHYRKSIAGTKPRPKWYCRMRAVCGFEYEYKNDHILNVPWSI